MNQEHYDLLLSCVRSGNFTPWVSLVNSTVVDLSDAILEGLDLRGVELGGAKLDKAKLARANLSGAKMRRTQLSQAEFQDTVLSGADFTEANVFRAAFLRTDLSSANALLLKAHGAVFSNARLVDANLTLAELNPTSPVGGGFSVDTCAATFEDCNLTGACLQKADVRGVDFRRSTVSRANFRQAKCDWATSLWSCVVDDLTDFRATDLSSVQAQPYVKQALSYNARRLNWQDWYDQAPWLVALPWRAFWAISDYGRSTGRIATWFVLLAALFAVVYHLGYFCLPPGFVDGFVRGAPPGTGVTTLLFYDLRAFYFSIVTMTTLGFGDMNAHDGSATGHLLLIAHVLVGYLLLAALVTRLAILFSAEGPGAEPIRARDSEGRSWWHRLWRGRANDTVDAAHRAHGIDE